MQHMGNVHSFNSLFQATKIDNLTRQILLAQLHIADLQDKIDDHDCHASPNDGCMCVDWYVELAKEVKNLKSLEVKFNEI